MLGKVPVIRVKKGFWVKSGILGAVGVLGNNRSWVQILILVYQPGVLDNLRNFPYEQTQTYLNNPNLT